MDPSSVIFDVACPDTDLCVAVDQDGNAVTTTNPTGAASDWNVDSIHDRSLTSVSCATTSLCVAVTDNECPPGVVCPAEVLPGAVITSTNPTGGTQAWADTPVTGAGNLYDVDCTSGLCVALDIDSQIVTSTDPTGGSGAWNVTDIAGSSSLMLRGVSCPSSSLCAAVGQEVHDLGGGFKVLESVIVTSTNPTGGVGAWTKAYLGPNSYLSAIDCPTTGFCLAVDEWGQAWSSTNPDGGAASWNGRFIDNNELIRDVSCASPSFCGVVDEAGQLLTSTNPSGGEEAWGTSTVPNIFSLSCPSASLCVAAGLGDIVVGTPPASEAPVHQLSPTPSPNLQPSLTLAPISKLIVKDGWVKLPQMTCTGYSSCSGGIKLTIAGDLIVRHGARGSRSGGVKVASRSFSIAPGTTMQLLAKLNKKGRKLFTTRRRVSARLLIDGRVSGGAIRVNRPVALRLQR